MLTISERVKPIPSSCGPAGEPSGRSSLSRVMAGGATIRRAVRLMRAVCLGRRMRARSGMVASGPKMAVRRAPEMEERLPESMRCEARPRIRRAVARCLWESSRA
jgi:hypothetical protein